MPCAKTYSCISFVTHYAWEFQHAGNVLMRSHYGLPGLPRTRLSRHRPSAAPSSALLA